jgi:hypothetical protein
MLTDRHDFAKSKLTDCAAEKKLQKNCNENKKKTIKKPIGHEKIFYENS